MWNLRDKLETILASGSGDLRRPVVGKGNESSVPGLHIVGDLAGAPVIKLAMAQGFEVIDYISQLPDMQRPAKDESILDVLIVGAGAAGLNAALAASDKGMKYLLLEKEKIANTIENFPEGKWVYAEPDSSPAKGKLWLDGARKEDLIQRWHQIVQDNQLNIHVEEPLKGFERGKNGIFEVRTEKGTYRARRIVLATGQRGNPRKLGVPGEESRGVYHRLYSPRKYQGEHILVVGGGNSAVEAALTLSEANQVTISYRGGEFSRLFKDNRQKLDRAIAEKRVEVVFHSSVREFREGEAVLSVDRGGSEDHQTLKIDHAFVLVGAELPVKFLKSLGIRLENDWTGVPLRAAFLALLALFALWVGGAGLQSESPQLLGFALANVPAEIAWLVASGAAVALLTLAIKADRWAFLALFFFVWYSVYGIKMGKGAEFWPYRGWGYETMSFLGRPWSFWYTVIYTGLITLFGIRALKRWGIDRKDKFQIWRYVSLISFQWTLLFLVPEFLFQWAVKYQWVGEALANNPQFAEQGWRTYGIVLAWPLFFYTFFYDPHLLWVVWGVALTFVVIPIFVVFYGKRYCSWICGCGGLAETFGDRWRHLAPKGKTSIHWEWMNLAILIAAVVITVAMLLRDSFYWLSAPAERGIYVYRVVADVWLIGILPQTLYPFLGGKVWCRYWCPLAKMMGLMSKLYTRLGISRFGIVSNDKCIACNECSRHCQVGIPVMQFALKQEVLNNDNSSCIGCGICVSVCPMDTLSFGTDPSALLPVVQKPAAVAQHAQT